MPKGIRKLLIVESALAKIAERCKRLRDDADMSQEDFGAAIGVSRQEISIIENSKRDYGISALLKILTYKHRDPLREIEDLAAAGAAMDADAVHAFNVLSGCLRDGRRESALQLIAALEGLPRARASPDKKASGH